MYVCASLCCSFKSATECTDVDSKYPSVPDCSVELDMSLSLVCDEEVISTVTDNRLIVGASPARKPDSDEKVKRASVGLTGKSERTVTRKVKPVHLSRFELEGLKAVVEWLESLPVGKRNVPKDLPEPDVLLSDVRVSHFVLIVLTLIDPCGLRFLSKSRYTGAAYAVGCDPFVCLVRSCSSVEMAEQMGLLCSRDATLVLSYIVLSEKFGCLQKWEYFSLELGAKLWT